MSCGRVYTAALPRMTSEGTALLVPIHKLSENLQKYRLSERRVQTGQTLSIDDIY